MRNERCRVVLDPKLGKKSFYLESAPEDAEPVIVQDMTDGTVIKHKKGDQVVTGTELGDLNRARAYLRDVAKRHGTAVYSSVEDAVEGD